MLENGFIKLHRSLLKWEWYDDVNTTRLFIHLLLTVNYEDEKWRGIEIKRGQRISSYEKLSAETKLSKKNVRTALKHLISTGEVTHETTSTYGLFTVLNYDLYQRAAHETADEGQSDGTQAAHEGQQRKKAKKDKNEKEKELDDFFEIIWKPYPKKQGKGAVSKTQKEVLFKIGVEEITRCIDRYKNYIRKNKIEPQFILHGSTFFNTGYIDYLDKNFIQEQKPILEISNNPEDWSGF